MFVNTVNKLRYHYRYRSLMLFREMIAVKKSYEIHKCILWVKFFIS